MRKVHIYVYLCLISVYIQCIQLYILMSHCNRWQKEAQFEINDNIWQCLCLIARFCWCFAGILCHFFDKFRIISSVKNCRNLFCRLDFSYSPKFSNIFSYLAYSCDILVYGILVFLINLMVLWHFTSAIP